MNYLRQLSKVFLLPVIIVGVMMGAVWIFITFNPVDILSYILSFFILAGISCFILSFIFKGKDANCMEDLD